MEAAAATSTPLVSATAVFYWLLAPALVLWYVYFRLQRRRIVELADKMPGPKGYPLIGNAIEFLGKNEGQ